MGFRWICWASMVCLFFTAAIALGQSPGPADPPDMDQNSAHSATPQSGSRKVSDPDIPDAPQPGDAQTQNKALNLPSALLHDQIGMWTSPAKARLVDATWLVPLGGFAAALFATDSDVSRHLSNSSSTLLQYKHISDYGAYSMAGGAAGLYLLGLSTGNEHERETGFLSGEAAIDSLAAVEAIKYASGRERPYLDNANGKFFKSGSSFPSEHSAAAWAIAGVVSHEFSLLRFGRTGQRLSRQRQAAFSLGRSGGRGHRLFDQRLRLSPASQSRPERIGVGVARHPARPAGTLADQIHGVALCASG